jgi:hypothetical protein
VFGLPLTTLLESVMSKAEAKSFFTAQAHPFAKPDEKSAINDSHLRVFFEKNQEQSNLLLLHPPYLSLNDSL